MLFPPTPTNNGSSGTAPDEQPAAAAAQRRSQFAGSGLCGEKGNTMKRIKLINDIPPVQNGVVSASKTPTIDEGRVFDISTTTVQDMSYFFDNGVKNNEDIPEYNVAGYLKTSLTSTRESEDGLRNAVFTDLMDNHGINFPESSIPKESGERARTRFTKLLRIGFFKPKKKHYAESELASLLVEYGQTQGRVVTQMRRIVRGLPVTTTSRPDLAPLDGTGKALQIRLGEFKNLENYTVDQARTQGVMHLLGLMYWLRVEMGRPVESVYGFFFCGCRCKDQRKKTYTVGLIQLSAPRFLGDNMKVVTLVKTSSTKNLFALQFLIHYLKTGKRWGVADRADLDESQRIPSVFTLPTSLWDDDQNRKLVLHGKLSIVFHLTAKGLQELILDPESPHFKSISANKRYQNWSETQKYVLDLGKETNEEATDTRYFLKIRTKDMSAQRHPMGAMVDVWDLLVGDNEDSDVVCPIKNTYPLMPFSIEQIGVILMRDRGVRLRDVPDFGMSIMVEFQKVIDTAMFLSKCLPHGDVLPHNLVYNERKGEMTLIDLDEGMRKPELEGGMDRLLRRKNEYEGDNGDWYVALMYPNALREHASSYTKAQLIASFLYLMGKIRDPSKEALELHDALHSKARELGQTLCTLDKENSSPPLNDENREKPLAMVDEVYKMMTSIVSQ